MNILKAENNIFKILIELFVFDKKKRGKFKARWAKMHLKKYADKVLDNIKYGDINNTPVNKIWIYWHQGIDNAPEIVKKCVESIKKYESDKEIHILSFDTISDYVDIPGHYYDLVRSGKMKIAHFSDILRLYLLEKYGGIWIDSTIYLTDSLPKEITGSVFFAPQKDRNLDIAENIMSCFLIAAKKGAKNITALRLCLDLYWAQNDFAINYFMFEHFATLLSANPELKNEWDEMTYINAEDMGLLQKKLSEEFNDSEFETIKNKISLHKLTYKKMNNQKNEKTYYKHLIQGGTL